MSRHLRTGKSGEKLAMWYLRLSGYRIVERNYRCRPGEIDIIAQKGNLLVFVEVRTRISGTLQHPLETVDPVKVSRTVQAARTYLLLFRAPLPCCRFDVIGITAADRFPFRRLWHLKNAFNGTSDACREGLLMEVARKQKKFEKKGEWKMENGKWRFRRSNK
jgi:putative endonuclease